MVGSPKLPELAGSLGKSMKEFKKGVGNPGGEDGSAATPAVAAAPAPACTGCGTALQREWTHCPRCGVAARRNSASA